MYLNYVYTPDYHFLKKATVRKKEINAHRIKTYLGVSPLLHPYAYISPCGVAPFAPSCPKRAKRLQALLLASCGRQIKAQALKLHLNKLSAAVPYAENRSHISTSSKNFSRKTCIKKARPFDRASLLYQNLVLVTKFLGHNRLVCSGNLNQQHLLLST